MVYEFTPNDSNSYTYGHRLISSDDAKYVLNAHGDVVALLNDSGVLTKRYDYDAFGNELNIDTADTNPFRYCAEYFDTETGTIYLRARYYNVSNGRFTARDFHWNVGNMIYGDNPKTREYTDYLENIHIIRFPDYEAIRQSGNLYGYCLNNPVFFADATGESASAVFTGSWGIGGSLAFSDGLLPFGDLAGFFVGVGGTLVAGGMAISSWWKNLTKDKDTEAVATKEVTNTPKQENPTYYHVTSQENAAKIVSTGKITAGEGGYVYAWKKCPSKDAISQSGARYIGDDAVIVCFQTAAAFVPDNSVDKSIQKYAPVHTANVGNINIQNPMIIIIT